jgi:type II secretory ATPase GspE/PulE/Tfp pilus assembly ATPase PilB-like protein
VLPVTAKLKELIVEGASREMLRREALSEGILSLREAALEKLKTGLTTLEEVIRETAND